MTRKLLVLATATLMGCGQKSTPPQSANSLQAQRIRSREIPLSAIKPDPPTVAGLKVGEQGCVYLYLVSDERHLWLIPKNPVSRPEGHGCGDSSITVTRTAQGYVAYAKKFDGPRGVSDESFRAVGYIQAEIEVDATEVQP